MTQPSTELTQKRPGRTRIDRAPVAKVFGPVAKVLNPLLARVSGSRLIPLWAVLRHRGRRSGRWYATPVAVAWSDDSLFVPLPFGTSADWPRNVLAAGGAIVKWKGSEHRMVAPEIVSDSSAFPPLERRALSLLGIRGIMRLRFAPDTSIESSQPVHVQAAP